MQRKIPMLKVALGNFNSNQPINDKLELIITPIFNQIDKQEKYKDIIEQIKAVYLYELKQINFIREIYQENNYKIKNNRNEIDNKKLKEFIFNKKPALEDIEKFINETARKFDFASLREETKRLILKKKISKIQDAIRNILIENDKTIESLDSLLDDLKKNRKLELIKSDFETIFNNLLIDDTIFSTKKDAVQRARKEIGKIYSSINKELHNLPFAEQVEVLESKASQGVTAECNQSPSYQRLLSDMSIGTSTNKSLLPGTLGELNNEELNQVEELLKTINVNPSIAIPLNRFIQKKQQEIDETIDTHLKNLVLNGEEIKAVKLAFKAELNHGIQFDYIKLKERDGTINDNKLTCFIYEKLPHLRNLKPFIEEQVSKQRQRPINEEEQKEKAIKKISIDSINKIIELLSEYKKSNKKEFVDFTIRSIENAKDLIDHGNPFLRPCNANETTPSSIIYQLLKGIKSEENQHYKEMYFFSTFRRNNSSLAPLITQAFNCYSQAKKAIANVQKGLPVDNVEKDQPVVTNKKRYSSR